MPQSSSSALSLPEKVQRPEVLLRLCFVSSPFSSFLAVSSPIQHKPLILLAVEDAGFHLRAYKASEQSCSRVLCAQRRALHPVF